MSPGAAWWPESGASEREDRAQDAALAHELAASIEVLVAESERATRDGCALLLRSLGLTVTTAADSSEALDVVQRRRFDVVILDAALQPVGGGVMRAALNAHPGTLVILTTFTPTVRESLDALREGAWDYVPKPFPSAHLEILIGRAVHEVLTGRGRPLPRGEPDEASEASLLGDSPAVRRALDLARRVAATTAPVLIVGPSGTGKGRLARYIHARSSRAGSAFLIVNCSVVTAEELFGRSSRKGFRNAESGLLEAAAGGTISLNGLEGLSPGLQKQLQHVLERGELPSARSFGRSQPLNVRFISSVSDGSGAARPLPRVHRPLLEQLGKTTIRLPALQERADDIPGIATYSFRRCWLQQHGDAPMPRLTAEAQSWLRSLPWPGNIRQLSRVMRRLSVIAAPGADITPDDIPLIDGELEEAGGGVYAAILDDVYTAAKEKLITEFEREYLPRLVSRAQGNMTRAARMAEVDRKTLYRLMDKHGLRRAADEA